MSELLITTPRNYK